MTELSREMRRLQTKWQANVAWPRRIEWLRIEGLRGWTGQRVDFGFPLMAIVGENGSGKSTILQAAASVYRSERGSKHSYFPSEFFPDTPWDKIRNAKISYAIREGQNEISGHIHKPTDRWREVPDRHYREVRFIDLRRTQPITSQVGYAKLAKPAHEETQRTLFDETTLVRFSDILGRQYETAGFSLTNADNSRWVPIISMNGMEWSGFHSGAGELVLADLVKQGFPKYGLVLIDEIETSLHPRMQRRMVRDLADVCRVLELQIILTTHSPCILEELPPEARVQILNNPQEKRLVTGVSASFAMTQMDDEPHPEVEAFVEDEESQILLEELLVTEKPDLARRCKVLPYGAASVGRALGIMVNHKRFPRPTVVFLDGDQPLTEGCNLLPGNDAPERVVFESLKKMRWDDVASRVTRSPSDVIDALESAMTRSDHHDWVKAAADRLFIGGIELWRALASAWSTQCVSAAERQRTANAVQDAIEGLAGVSAAAQVAAKLISEARAAAMAKMEEAAAAIPPPKDDPLPDSSAKSSTKQGSLFEPESTPIAAT
jgi:predicted ATPase